MEEYLKKYICPEHICILHGKTKQDVLDEIIKKAANQADYDFDQIKKLVWEREELASTGLEHGIAVPHIRIQGLNDPLVLLGVCHNPIKDYDSLDCNPVRIVIFIAVEKNDHTLYLKLLSEISMLIRKTGLMANLTENIENPEEICKILSAY